MTRLSGISFLQRRFTGGLVTVKKEALGLVGQIQTVCCCRAGWFLDRVVTESVNGFVRGKDHKSAALRLKF